MLKNKCLVTFKKDLSYATQKKSKGRFSQK